MHFAHKDSARGQPASSADPPQRRSGAQRRQARSGQPSRAAPPPAIFKMHPKCTLHLKMGLLPAEAPLPHHCAPEGTTGRPGVGPESLAGRWGPFFGTRPAKNFCILKWARPQTCVNPLHEFRFFSRMQNFFRAEFCAQNFPRPRARQRGLPVNPSGEQWCGRGASSLQ